MNVYVIQSSGGLRIWYADSADHAVEQHDDAFPDESVMGVGIVVKASSEYPSVRADDSVAPASSAYGWLQ